MVLQSVDEAAHLAALQQLTKSIDHFRIGSEANAAEVVRARVDALP